VESHKPAAVVIDPITNLIGGNRHEIYAMLMRLLDFLKAQQITALFTALTSGANKDLEMTDVGISSLIDTWLFVRDVELNGERNRCVYVLKSRGMAHSNQVREFLMTDEGIRLVPVYVGSGTVLTGSARLSQEALEKAEALQRSQGIAERRRSMAQRRKAVEAQIAALRASLADEEARAGSILREDERRESRILQDARDIANHRKSSSIEKRRARSAG